jgi:NAD(P)-dependent dehydrogenase (short-subunit alcohol dehydrogenase family)
MAQPKLLVIVGSGPGIGVAAACKFASAGYNVALISRSLERLNDDVANVYAHLDQHKDSNQVTKGSQVKVRPFAADAADHVALRRALDEVYEAMGPPEVVLYNAARIKGMVIEEATVDDMMDDFKVCAMPSPMPFFSQNSIPPPSYPALPSWPWQVNQTICRLYYHPLTTPLLVQITNLGLHTTALWALPHLTSLAQTQAQSHFQSQTQSPKPTILLTSTSLTSLPKSLYFSLFTSKAAQRSYLDSLSEIASPKGIHVARVEINGVVADGDPVVNKTRVAEELFGLAAQGKGEWVSRVVLGDVERFREEVGRG